VAAKKRDNAKKLAKFDLELHEKRLKELTATAELKVKNSLLIFHYKRIIKSLKAEINE
jgi:hypothetical protein